MFRVFNGPFWGQLHTVADNIRAFLLKGMYEGRSHRYPALRNIRQVFLVENTGGGGRDRQ